MLMQMNLILPLSYVEQLSTSHRSSRNQPGKIEPALDAVSVPLHGVRSRRQNFMHQCRDGPTEKIDDLELHKRSLRELYCELCR